MGTASNLLKLYNTLPTIERVKFLAKIKQETAQKPILKEHLNDQHTTIADELSAMANKSFGDIWENSENEHWDEFLKNRSDVQTR